MQTTAGSLALVGARPPRDAEVVRRLRAAGCVVLGKTNLSEWANFRSPHSTSGWSARGGLCRNPHALDHNPCGSSSGSAAAVAASLAPLAIGTETDGSIVSPASACGVVGLKPTVGLVSRAGIVPISPSQDTAGPMGRCVADVSLLLGAIAGTDPRDPATAEADARRLQDYTVGLDPGGLRHARIGVLRQASGFDDRVECVFESALDALRRAGATLVDPVVLPDLGDLFPLELEVLLHEFAAALPAYLAELEGDVAVRTLEDAIAFNTRHADRELAYFGQETFEAAARRAGLDAPIYRESLRLARRLARDDGVDAVCREHALHAITAPTLGPARACRLGQKDRFDGGSATWAAVGGLPHLSVPMGTVDALPVGLSFFGVAWSEPTLLRIGYAFECATGVRPVPGYREPSTGPSVAPA